MKRQIIHIDEAKCNGCGACASACHEGAIGMVNGRAKLLREDWCDGMGDCLPQCPTGAITFEERDAAPWDEAAVRAARQTQVPPAEGCPGSRMMQMDRDADEESPAGRGEHQPSQLRQWPVQIRLVPVHAPYFQGANLLIAADCTAYAYAAFHRDFIRGKITLVGCPKLDGVDYSEKLTEIFRSNEIASVTIVRMEVPCCQGLEVAARKALRSSGKLIPWQTVTVSVDGRILDR